MNLADKKNKNAPECISGKRCAFTAVEQGCGQTASVEKERKSTDGWREGSGGRAEIIAHPCETFGGYNTASGELGCAYGKRVFQRKVRSHESAEIFSS